MSLPRSVLLYVLIVNIFIPPCDIHIIFCVLLAPHEKEHWCRVAKKYKKICIGKLYCQMLRLLCEWSCMVKQFFGAHWFKRCNARVQISSSAWRDSLFSSSSLSLTTSFDCLFFGPLYFRFRRKRTVFLQSSFNLVATIFLVIVPNFPPWYAFALSPTQQTLTFFKNNQHVKEGINNKTHAGRDFLIVCSYFPLDYLSFGPASTLPVLKLTPRQAQKLSCFFFSSPKFACTSQRARFRLHSVNITP